MDSPFDIEALRAQLKAMSRPDVMRLADESGLALSSVEKFRNGHTDEPKLANLVKLATALKAREAA